MSRNQIVSEANRHAKRRLDEAVKYVSRQWGHGWPRLSDGQREAYVRAEMLAEISRISGPQTDPAHYQDMVCAMAEAAVQWEGLTPAMASLREDSK